MTKYEWETELRKSIHRLPADEIKRVLEYYGELFEDMIERGKSEREIINEFGNPVDVADKILSEYEELGDRSDTVVPTPAASAKTCDEGIATETERVENIEQKSVTAETSKEKIDIVRLALFVVFNVLTCGALFIVVGTVWILLAAFTVCGGALVIGGGVACISSFAVMASSAGAGIAQLGVGVALAGAGILLAVGCVILIKLYARFNVWAFGAIKNLLTVKEK